MFKLDFSKCDFDKRPAPLASAVCVPILWPAPPAVNSASQQQRVPLIRYRKASPISEAAASSASTWV